MRIPNPQDLNELPHIDIFRCAMGRLVRGDKNYILTDVSERSVCARLACYLEAMARRYSRLKGYYADVENNRKQNGEVKTILDGNDVVVTVTCDLILHSRGEIAYRDNLIAIEMKKEGRSEESKNNDRMRLRALTRPVNQNGIPQIWRYNNNNNNAEPEHVCGYELGIFIVLNIELEIIEVQYFFRGDAVGGIETFKLNQ